MTADDLRRLAAALGIELLDDEIEADLAELEAMLANARRLAERLTSDDEPALTAEPA
ncbi:MAG: hypothetical protein RMM58_11640 [Chloroflexota bacterium]|nr:hypothetical protein [Dehalococcoidia bacterium]MDW8254517.1 hypothetical protein [Chloroflexota bacterium]